MYVFSIGINVSISICIFRYIRICICICRSTSMSMYIYTVEAVDCQAVTGNIVWLKASRGACCWMQIVTYSRYALVWKRKSDLGNNKICRPLHRDIINNCIFISLRLKFLNSPRGLIGIASEMDVGQKPSAWQAPIRKSRKVITQKPMNKNAYFSLMFVFFVNHLAQSRPEILSSTFRIPPRTPVMWPFAGSVGRASKLHTRHDFCPWLFIKPADAA